MESETRKAVSEKVGEAKLIHEDMATATIYTYWAKIDIAKLEVPLMAIMAHKLPEMPQPTQVTDLWSGMYCRFDTDTKLWADTDIPDFLAKFLGEAMRYGKLDFDRWYYITIRQEQVTAQPIMFNEGAKVIN